MAALLSWINWCDRAAASLTSATWVPSQPPSRLAETPLRRRWRTPVGTTAPTLNVDFGVAREVGVLALAQPTDAGGIDPDGEPKGWMQPTDTVRHRLDAVAAGAGVLLDGGVQAGGWQPGYGTHAIRLAAPVSARYWQADLDAASLAGGVDYLDLGRAWAGPAWQPTTGSIRYGWGSAWDDPSDAQRNARSGLETVDVLEPAQVLTFALRLFTQADADNIREMTRVAGRRGQVLFLPFDDQRYPPVIGRLQQVPTITQPHFATFDVAFQLRQTL